MSQKPPRSATTAQERPPHPATAAQRKVAPHPATVAQRKVAPHPAAAAQRKVAPHPATVAQRNVAPHPAVAQRKVASHVATVLQRSSASEDSKDSKDPGPGLREGESGEVASGKTLKFTALAAGCLAVAANLAEGGAAGVHLAMLLDNEVQWSTFLKLVNDRKVASIVLYGDMLGVKDGWYVNIGPWDNELFMHDPPGLDESPRSLHSLKKAGVDLSVEHSPWDYNDGSIQEWFRDKFDLKSANVKWIATSKAVDHKC